MAGDKDSSILVHGPIIPVFGMVCQASTQDIQKGANQVLKK
jgi:hypothetical protein